MRILFVVGSFPKLSETFILNQITGLIDQGNDVTVLAEKPQFKEDYHDDVIKYNLLEKTIYYNYPKNKINKLSFLLKFIVLFLLSNPFMVLKALNFFKYGKEILSLKHIFVYDALKKGENNLKYDVVHCHFGPNGILGVILRDLGILKGRVLTTFHGYDMNAYLKIRGKSVYNFLFENGDIFLPISDFWKRKLIELGCPSNKIKVHPMGVDIEKFPLLSLSKNNNNVKCISIARLVEKKGIEIGIQAIINLIKNNYKINYDIVGNGPLEEYLKKISNNKSEINFLGWKTQEEAIELIKEADILLAPSITSEDGDMEGIPVVLMEAMAMGKIVISTYHSGIPELIQDKKNGFLVKEKDMEGLYNKIEDIIVNKYDIENISLLARETIDVKHNIKILNERLQDIMLKSVNG